MALTILDKKIDVLATCFLPQRVPSRQLPDRWKIYQETAAELPSRYCKIDADIRPWLDRKFALGVGDAEYAVNLLTEPQLDRLMTVLSVLGHCYRWSSAPPRSENYHITRIDIPPGIDNVWTAACHRQGQPRVGNLYSMVISNWDIDGCDGDESYEPATLTDERIRIAVPWLAPPKEDELRSFLRAGIETEALGSYAIKTSLEIIQSCKNRDIQSVIYLFERLHSEIEIMSKAFRTHVQKCHFTSDDFLTLIQPTTLWGIDQGDGALEGPSGPQVGVLQVLDAVLGIERKSSMAHVVVHTRKFLTARHRNFLNKMDQLAPIVTNFINSEDNSELTNLYNNCVILMRNWRLVHQKRAAMFLKADTPGLVTDYASTGGVVALEDERIRRFETEMQGRIADTVAAVVKKKTCPFSF